MRQTVLMAAQASTKIAAMTREKIQAWRTLISPVTRWRLAVRGFSRSKGRSKIRLMPMAKERTPTMAMVNRMILSHGGMPPAAMTEPAQA